MPLRICGMPARFTCFTKHIGLFSNSGSKVNFENDNSSRNNLDKGHWDFLLRRWQFSKHSTFSTQLEVLDEALGKAGFISPRIFTVLRSQPALIPISNAGGKRPDQAEIWWLHPLWRWEAQHIWFPKQILCSPVFTSSRNTQGKSRLPWKPWVHYSPHFQSISCRW